MRRFLPALALALVACSSLNEIPDSCFVAGTKVRTPSGSVRIEDLREGDLVLAFDATTGSTVTRTVIATFGGVVSRVRVFELEDGTTITTTDEHPFWDGERRAWLPAREVERGAVLARLDTGDGRTTRPVLVRATRDEPRAPTRVYNLTVDGEHTFFAEGVATHNKSVLCRDCVDTRSDALIIDNLTGEPIDLTVFRARDNMTLSRDVAEGTKRLPFASQLFDESPDMIGAGGSLSIVNLVGIDRGQDDTASRRVAAVVALRFEGEGSEPFLAIGSGTLQIVRRDGKLVVEAKDPRSVLVTTFEGVSGGKCATATRVRGFDADDADLTAFSGTTTSIVAIEPQGECKALIVGERSGRRVTISACLPDDAIPFAVDDAIMLSTEVGADATGIHLERSDGAKLDLLRIETRLQKAFSFRDFALERTDAKDTCSHEANFCERLVVPTSVSVTNAPTDGRRLVPLGGASCQASLCAAGACSGSASFDLALVTPAPATE